MKTFIKVLFSIALAAAFCSCDNSDRKPEYVYYNVVNFYGSSYAVAEDTVQFKIPVQVSPKIPGDVTVTVKVIDEGATAVKGTDYSIVSEVLTFSAEDESNTKDIVVNVTDFPGLYTGSKVFALEISNVVGDGVYAGPNSVVEVEIQDLDHPLSAILKEYTITGTAFYSGSLYPFSAFGFSSAKFLPDKDDVTKIWIEFLSPLEVSAYGIVSEDKKTITLPYGQKTVVKEDDETYTFMFLETVYDAGKPGVVYTEPKEGDCATFKLDETAEGTVYTSSDDFDFWLLDEGGSPKSYKVPVCGTKWGTIVSATLVTKLTMK